jgi:hypothetical protein
MPAPQRTFLWCFFVIRAIIHLAQEYFAMDIKRDYYEDVQFFTSGVIVFWFAALMVFLAVFPFLFKNYYVYV